jgi:osmoprotectant transport system ATP-binding protein
VPQNETPSEALIHFDGVGMTYADGTVAVGHLDLDVAAHELLTLVGPSGSGKSTLLRMVNRLVEPTSGRVLLEGEDVSRMDAARLRRGIGYVIQDVGLFPHRTVAQNVATVPGLLGWDRRRTRERVEELLTLVRLDPAVHGPRYPHELSGGQRQRVGVARALATHPKVMLMDEPFGAVDPEGRRSLQTEFRRIHDELGTTVLMVTHDIDEAVMLGDRVAVLSQGGRLEQLAPPATLLSRPANAFVEGFIGDARAVKLLGLTELVRADVELSPGTPAANAGSPGAAPARVGAPTVRLGDTLGVAFSALATAEDGVVAVVDDGGSAVGTLTPAGLHAALRRAVRTDGS